MSVMVCLDDETDVSCGDMLVHPEYAPHVTRVFDARLVWMSTSPLKKGHPYLIKHTARSINAVFRSIRYKINVNTLERQQVEQLGFNDIGSVVVETTRPVFVDPYRRNRGTGSFIVIDPVTNETVGAGMITGREVRDVKETGALSGGQAVSAAERREKFGHGPQSSV